MADLLIDTDVFVYHLRGAHALRPKKHRPFYSVITRAELSAGTTASDAVSRLLCAFRELPVDGDVAEGAGRIRRESGLRLPDALVTATALVHGLSLVTGAVVTSNPSPGRLHDSSSDGARRQRARVDAGTLQEIAALIRTKV